MSALTKAQPAPAVAAGEPSLPAPPNPHGRKRGRPPRQIGAGTPSPKPSKPRADDAAVAKADDRTRLIATVILDVLGGNRSPTDAAAALDLSLARYYTLEQQAIAGLVRACQPRPMGPSPDLARQVQQLQAENRRLGQALLRQQALVRAGQRSLGLSLPARAKPGPGAPADAAHGKPRRRHRPTVRALRAVQRLGPKMAAATEPAVTAGVSVPAPPRSTAGDGPPAPG